ncbi:hypothetical protein [Pelomonas sp. SE-A7]|uniref:hypothetical protein n=1 Tax=Pelomonas sp. SE-A7 TaxID=3054953 RepID=UPI00259CD7C2|nr:hypothetical protein [Pelomonas sp. SE-A7]MDM4766638.1 hypothetical protein [Pelomonas sp. SE-A7]
MTALALAGNPVFSGPSVGKASTAAEFKGSGFAANASVLVMVKSPDGNSAGYSAVTDASGEFRFTLTPSQSGVYTLTVANSGGQSLASATVSILS